MSESFSADTHQLRRLAVRFADIAEQAAALAEQLGAALTQEGASWGDDELGHTFAQTYRPAMSSGLSGLGNAVDNVRQEAEALAAMATTLEQQDLEGATRLLNAGTVTSQPSIIQQPGGDVRPVPIALSDTSSASTAVAPSPSPDAHPTGPSTHPSKRSPESYPVAPDTRPQNTPRPAAGDVPARDGATQPAGDLRSPAGKPPRSGALGPSVTAGSPYTASTGRTAAPGRKPVPNDYRRHVDTSEPQRGTAPRVDGKPVDRNATPTRAVGRPPVARIPVSASDTGRPDPHPTAPSARRGTQRERAVRSESAAAVNAAIAHELAARYGIEVIGFTLPGVEETVLREIAAAFADVLPNYSTIDLRRFAIADLQGRFAVTGWGRVPGPDETWTRASWIALDVESARNPDTLLHAVRAATESGYLARGCDARPVYSTIVREFGRALDVAGGFHARRRAQSALIAHFMERPHTAVPPRSLGRIVRDYVDWRARLPGCCFPEGRFDPADALAEAFVEAHLRSDDVCPQAAVLHALLVDTASRPTDR